MRQFFQPSEGDLILSVPSPLCALRDAVVWGHSTIGRYIQLKTITLGFGYNRWGMACIEFFQLLLRLLPSVTPLIPVCERCGNKHETTLHASNQARP